MDDLIEQIQAWSIDRDLDKQDSAKQLLKLQEELGELTQAYLKEYPDNVVDSLGDMFVVMVIFCQQQGLKMRDCIGYAFHQISNRKGKMIDGVFVKEEDLTDEKK